MTAFPSAAQSETVPNRTDKDLIRMTEELRRTKILFTIGPATESEEMIGRLIAAGAGLCRINMAHATPEWTRMILRRVREVGARAGREIATVVDVKGPEIRTGDVDTPIELNQGQRFDFLLTGDAEPVTGVAAVGVNYEGLGDDIHLGDTI